MELSSGEEEMPIPINSTTYGGEHGNGHGHEGRGNMAHHHHHLHHGEDPSNGSSITQKQALQDHHQDHGPYMKKKKEVIIKYRECLKNHAASMGGNVLDGCGEFMPSGEEGTIEALTCSACNCHRNFHRKEVQGDDPPPPPPSYYRFGRKLYFGDLHQKSVLATAPEQALVGYPTGNILPSRTVPPPPHQMILPYNVVGPTSGPLVPSESDEQEDAVTGGGGMVMSSGRPASSSQIVGKKRFRTKFTQEQKEKMLDFAERVGWKIQKQEESVVQHFCQEIGVRRRVLKVWMHNNKHNLATKINNPLPPPPPPPTTSSTPTTALVS